MVMEHNKLDIHQLSQDLSDLCVKHQIQMEGHVYTDEPRDFTFSSVGNTYDGCCNILGITTELKERKIVSIKRSEEKDVSF
jgi:hypothetical protein